MGGVRGVSFTHGRGNGGVFSPMRGLRGGVFSPMGGVRGCLVDQGRGKGDIISSMCAFHPWEGYRGVFSTLGELRVVSFTHGRGKGDVMNKGESFHLRKG